MNVSSFDPNSIWISSFGKGIYRITEKDTLHIGMENGLPNGSIYNVLQADSSTFWIPTNRGLIYSDHSFQTMVTLTNDSYYLNTNANQNGSNSYGNEMFSFCGANGAILINRKNWKNLSDLFGNTYVSKMSFHTKGQSFKENMSYLKLKHDFISFESGTTLQFWLGFSPFCSTNSKLDYRILPDTEWISNKDGSQPIRISTAKNGIHTLEIRRINPYNLSFSIQKVGTFEVVTYWYNTLFFKVVTGFTILFILVILIQQTVKLSYRKKLLLLEKNKFNSVSANIYLEIYMILSEPNSV
ncbi:MAG: hypothetical protein GW817_09310 [Flavobacteriales bacterium]|nr:hypothetical protein [Flavobacteriales bacterium]NCQ11607.1 hypothetical protein [Bacteroidota bacterium]